MCVCGGGEKIDKKWKAAEEERKRVGRGNRGEGEEEEDEGGDGGGNSVTLVTTTLKVHMLLCRPPDPCPPSLTQLTTQRNATGKKEYSSVHKGKQDWENILKEGLSRGTETEKIKQKNFGTSNCRKSGCHHVLRVQYGIQTRVRVFYLPG